MKISIKFQLKLFSETEGFKKGWSSLTANLNLEREHGYEGRIHFSNQVTFQQWLGSKGYEVNNLSDFKGNVKISCHRFHVRQHVILDALHPCMTISEEWHVSARLQFYHTKHAWFLFRLTTVPSKHKQTAKLPAFFVGGILPFFISVFNEHDICGKWREFVMELRLPECGRNERFSSSGFEAQSCHFKIEACYEQNEKLKLQSAIEVRHLIEVLLTQIKMWLAVFVTFF